MYNSPKLYQTAKLLISNGISKIFAMIIIKLYCIPKSKILKQLDRKPI